MSRAVSAWAIQRMQWARRAGPRRYWPRRWPLPRPPRIWRSWTRRSSMTISLWPVPPCMVSTSRTSFQPSLRDVDEEGGVGAAGALGHVDLGAGDEDGELGPAGVGDEPLVAVDDPLVAVLARRGSGSASGRSRRPRARSWRSTTSWCPRTAAGGTSPSARRSAQCRSVCMLPSSGAMQLRIHGPRRVLAASACTMASSTWPRPMPPHSLGMCGSQRPSAWALARELEDGRDVLVAGGDLLLVVEVLDRRA